MATVAKVFFGHLAPADDDPNLRNETPLGTSQLEHRVDRKLFPKGAAWMSSYQIADDKESRALRKELGLPELTGEEREQKP